MNKIIQILSECFQQQQKFESGEWIAETPPYLVIAFIAPQRKK
jgi:hypothetical protein